MSNRWDSEKLTPRRTRVAPSRRLASLRKLRVLQERADGQLPLTEGGAQVEGAAARRDESGKRVPVRGGEGGEGKRSGEKDARG